MRRVGPGFPITLFTALCGLALLVCPRFSTAQSIQVPTSAQQHGDTRATDDYAAAGQITVQIQDAFGAAFFQGARVAVLTNLIDTTLIMVSDPGGNARFTGLPVGQYVVEISAAGYRTVQQQVLISGTSKSPSITVSMVPAADKKAVKVRVGSASVSSKAVKESERALHSLQLNNLADAQQHLERALAFEQDYSEADYLMGLLLLRQKDPARAAGYLQKSLALSPDQAPALLALSQAQYLQQDYPAATVSLERFLRDYPHDPQASNAQKYLDSMQKSRTANAGAMESAAESTPSGPSDNPPAAAGTAAATTDLPSLLESFAESNTWAPPNVDDEKIDIDASSAPCKLDSVLHSAGQRVRELVQNVDRFTATENLEHTNLNRMGLKTYSETRKFNYLVEIRPVDTTGINVEEYRNGSDSARQFPEEITTSGLPALAMIFHPNLQTRYEFDCQGRSTWGGRPAWVVRFEQRSGQNSSMLTYQVGKRYYAVGLKGRAWIDAANSQVMAMESDIMRPVPEIHLVRDHQLIEYGPVHFQNKSLELWLPKSADWYCSLNGKRFHRRHTFSKFMLFSVDDKQNISAPVVVPAENTQQPSGNPPATY